VTDPSGGLTARPTQIRPFRDAGPLVVKIGGAGVDEPRGSGELWSALAEAHQELAGRLVLVHGGGRAVDAHLERLGFATQRIAGLRVTPSEQMGEVAAVLAGRVNKALVGAIQRAGVPACGLCLGDGSAVRCGKLTHPEGDLGRVGKVVGGDGRVLRTLMDSGVLPVLCSIGLDDDGEFLNVNADDAAAGVAAVLGARALVLLTDVEGILGADGQRIERIDAVGIERLISEGVIRAGMVPKARAAVAAASTSGAPTVIASFRRPRDLVRIARGDLAGTVVEPGLATEAHRGIQR
jgi:acetylglutamate kinase